MNSGIFVTFRFDVAPGLPVGTETNVFFRHDATNTMTVNVGTGSNPLDLEDGSVTIIQDTFDLTINNFPTATEMGVTITDQTASSPRLMDTPLNLTYGTAGNWEFLGWATNESDFDEANGMEWDNAVYNGYIIPLSGLNMPASDLTVYAVWGIDNIIGGGNVNVTVEIRSASGTLLTYAALTHNDTPVTRNANGTFRINVSEYHIDDILTAGHAGFANNIHKIAEDDLVQPRLIVIVLGDKEGYYTHPYQPRDDRYYGKMDLRVYVRDEVGNAISGSDLNFESWNNAAVAGANGVFNVLVDARNVTEVLTANSLGFAESTHALTYADLARGYVTITLLDGDAAPVRVEIRSVSGMLLAHPNAVLSGIAYDKNEDGTFTINISSVNFDTVLAASHAGFADSTHAITASDLNAPRIITIVLDYEDVNLTVYVSNTEGQVITTSNLTFASWNNAAITGANGIFRVTVDARNVGETLKAAADGFAEEAHSITYADLARGYVVITLPVGDAVAVTVRVISVMGVYLEAATLTGVVSKNNNDGTFTIHIDGSYIGNVLTASHDDFTDSTHVIFASDLNAPRTITIVLDYEEVNLTVHVRNTEGQAITTSNLTFASWNNAAITGANGIFRVVVDARNVGETLKAFADGFAEETHSITYADLVRGYIVITLPVGDAVAVTVRVVSMRNIYLEDAALTGVDSINHNDGTFTIYIDGSYIGKVLTASHEDFFDGTRTIAARDLTAPRVITIVLHTDDDRGEVGSYIQHYVVRFYRNTPGGDLSNPSELHEVVYVRRGSTIAPPIAPTHTALVMVPVFTPEAEHDEEEAKCGEGDIAEEDTIIDENAATDEDTTAEDEDTIAEEETVPDEEAIAEDEEVTIEEYSTGETPYESVESNDEFEMTEGSTETEIPHEFSIEAFEMVLTQVDYIFTGWYTVPNPTPAHRFDFNTPIMEHLNLYAQWVADDGMVVGGGNDPGDKDETGSGNEADDNGELDDGDEADNKGEPGGEGEADVEDETVDEGEVTGEDGIGNEDDAPPEHTVNQPQQPWIPLQQSSHRVASAVEELPEEEIPLTAWDGVHHAFLIGFADGTVRPRAEVTRAQVATILFRMMTDEARAAQWRQDNPFTDVVLTNWHNNAVSTTFNADIFRGMPDGTFMPDRSITRAELAATIVRFMHVSPNYGAAQFNDIAGHWAFGYVNAAALNGWVIGNTGLGGEFRPSDIITRAEVAAIVNRAFERLPEGPEYLLEGMRIWPDNANVNAWYYLYIQEATNSQYFRMKDDGVHKTWIELYTPERQWELLERPDSRPGDIFVTAQPWAADDSVENGYNEDYKPEEEYEYDAYGTEDDDEDYDGDNDET